MAAHLTWLELRQELAATSPDSRERFLARRDLPALAKRLREARLCLPSHHVIAKCSRSERI